MLFEHSVLCVSDGGMGNEDQTETNVHNLANFSALVALAVHLQQVLVEERQGFVHQVVQVVDGDVSVEDGLNPEEGQDEVAECLLVPAQRGQSPLSGVLLFSHVDFPNFFE